MGVRRPLPCPFALPLAVLFVSVLMAATPAAGARLPLATAVRKLLPAALAGGSGSTGAAQRRRLLDTASLAVSNGNCTKDVQLGVSYPVIAGFDPATCAGTFKAGADTFCTTNPQTVPGSTPNAQATLALPSSKDPTIQATYVTAYSSPSSVFPTTYDPTASVWSTVDGYLCNAGDDGCFFFFFVTQQPVVLQCIDSSGGGGGGGSGGDCGSDCGGSSNIGVIVGAVVGAVVVVAAVAGLAVFMVRRRRRQQAAQPSLPEAGYAEGGYDYRIDSKAGEDGPLYGQKPGSPGAPPPGAYSPMAGAVAAMGSGPADTARASGSAATGSLQSREGEAQRAGSSVTGSMPGSAGGAAMLSLQSHASSRSGATAARVRQLTQDDIILSYIHGKLPMLASHGSGVTRGSSDFAGRRPSAGVDARSWEVAFEEIDVSKPIGEGSFGRVYLARWHHTTVAVKILIDKAAVHEDPDSTAAMMLSASLQAKLDEEASLLALMRHPNIVSFLGVCHTPPCILTEYCSRGSLTDVLSRARRDPARAAELTWRRRLALAQDAALGMLYLHTRPNPIVHRDLKSPNLLVDESWHVKVTDFNLSRLLEDSLGSKSSSMAALNPRWLAPEVMQGGSAGMSCDVYSFAIVMWELLTWELPWSTVNAWALVQQLMGGARPEVPALEALPGPDKPPQASYDAYVALMRACWAPEEQARPNFDAISTDLSRLLEGVAEA